MTLSSRPFIIPDAEELQTLLSAILCVFKSRSSTSKEVICIHSFFSKYVLDAPAGHSIQWLDCFGFSIRTESSVSFIYSLWSIHFFSLDVVTRWLQSLPKHFLAIKSTEEERSDLTNLRRQCLLTMLQAGAQGHEVFLEAVQESMDQILGEHSPACLNYS